MNALLLFLGFAIVTCAVHATAGLAPAAAVVAFAGWMRAEAQRRGAMSRLVAAGLALEEAGKARAFAEKRLADATMINVVVTQANASGEAEAEDSPEGRTVH